MPFVLTPNVDVDIWVNVAVEPWVTGDPPDFPAVPMQKIKSWLAVASEQVAGLEAGGISIHRFIWDETPLANAIWTETSGNHTFFRIDAGGENLWYCVMAVDHFFAEGDVATNMAWCTMQLGE